MKRGLVISFSCSARDKATTERYCRELGGPFGPTVSTLAFLILRHGLTQLMRGDLTLDKLAKYAEAEVTAEAR
jgi:hypothetical protein